VSNQVRSGAIRVVTPTPFGGLAAVNRPAGVARRTPGSEIRVAVVEPETLSRMMMADSINRTAGMRTVILAANLAELRSKVRNAWMDVLVLEVDLPDGNGVTLGLELQRTDPHLSVVTVTRHDVRAVIETTERHLRRPWLHVSKMSPNGAHDLVAAIRQAANGTDKSLLGRPSNNQPAADTFGRLTAQQLAVLRLISEGFTNNQVSERLEVSRRTVENHLLAIYRAFEISSEDINPRVTAVLRFLSHSMRY
jgi:DNA-binding NarL/FixJ family response regulator